MTHYIGQKLARIDPIPQLPARHAKPFYWSKVQVLMKVDARGETCLAELEQADIGDGLALQVYGSHLCNAYARPRVGETRPDVAPAEIFTVQCATQIAQVHYVI